MARQIIIAVMFTASIAFAFWLINFDEMIKAFIGFAIIVGWFYAFVLSELKKEEQAEQEASKENSS